MLFAVLGVWALSDGDAATAQIAPSSAGDAPPDAAQSSPIAATAPPSAATAPRFAAETVPFHRDAAGDSGWLQAVLGSTPHRDRLIVGLWAMHPFEPQFPELDGTRGFGGVYGHWFAATFVNSYDERTLALGIERNWLRVGQGRIGLGAGYRVGLIAGYDERLVEFARHTPVLPFGGVVVWARFGPLAIDSYYVYRAITLETSVVF